LQASVHEPGGDAQSRPAKMRKNGECQDSDTVDLAPVPKELNSLLTKSPLADSM